MAHTNKFNTMKRIIGNLEGHEDKLLRILDNIVQKEESSFTRQTCNYTGNPDVNLNSDVENPYEHLQKFNTPWNLPVPPLDYKCDNSNNTIEDSKDNETSKPKDDLTSGRKMLLQEKLKLVEEEIQELRLRLDHTIANLVDVRQQIEELRQQEIQDSSSSKLEEINVENKDTINDEQEEQEHNDEEQDEEDYEELDEKDIPDYKYKTMFICNSDAKKYFKLNGSIIHSKTSGFCIIFKSIYCIILFKFLEDVNFIGEIVNRTRDIISLPRNTSIEIQNIKNGTEYVITKYDYEYGIRRLV